MIRPVLLGCRNRAHAHSTNERGEAPKAYIPVCAGAQIHLKFMLLFSTWWKHDTYTSMFNGRLDPVPLNSLDCGC